MLARAARSLSDPEIARLYRTGKYVRSSFLSARISKCPGSQTRFAVVVSKKISKKATVRNRSRRRVYAAIRGLYPTLPGGYGIIISVHNDIGRGPYQAIQSATRQLTKQAGLI